MSRAPDELALLVEIADLIEQGCIAKIALGDGA